MSIKEWQPWKLVLVWAVAALAEVALFDYIASSDGSSGYTPHLLTQAIPVAAVLITWRRFAKTWSLELWVLRFCTAFFAWALITASVALWKHTPDALPGGHAKDFWLYAGEVTLLIGMQMQSNRARLAFAGLAMLILLPGAWQLLNLSGWHPAWWTHG